MGCRHLHDYSDRFLHNVNKKIIRNVSDEEFHAIRTLKNNTEIIISPADKGNTVVIMDKKDYIEKMQQIVKRKQFQHTPNSLLKEKENEMNTYLRQLLNKNVITKELFHQIRSTCSSSSCMYGQPKIHKQGYALRPIISSIGSYNYELSKYLANILKNSRPTKPNSYIRDSFDLVTKIKNMNCNKNKIMCSFDIDALYTNVSVKEAIEIAVNNMIRSKMINNTPFNGTQLKRLLEIAVCNVPFRFINDNYLQINGVAMGPPLGPILADIFMTNLGKKLNRFSKNKPQIWYRYVDDIFCVFNSEQNINDVLQRINK